MLISDLRFSKKIKIGYTVINGYIYIRVYIYFLKNLKNLESIIKETLCWANGYIYIFSEKFQKSDVMYGYIFIYIYPLMTVIQNRIQEVFTLVSRH